MEKETLQTLLVAQVLTLATALKTQSKVENRQVSTDWEREAVRLIQHRSSAVLALLAEKP